MTRAAPEVYVAKRSRKGRSMFRNNHAAEMAIADKQQINLPWSM